MFYQLLSLVGAALILVAYIALQLGRFTQKDRIFNALNFLGSAMLTCVALADWRIGFIVLEAAWALLSIPGMFRRRATA
jgi:multisubunit Na+/H+ antiporter MnhB subunit